MDAQAAQGSLHDDFMSSLQDTNMMGYAMAIDMVQDGQLSDGARMQDELRGWPMESSGMLRQAPGLSQSEIDAGELVSLEAQVACDEAINAAELVKKRQRESMEHFAEEESSSMATPNKRQRTKGVGIRSSETSGRSGSKGLRHFSMKVCEKVESKGRTTYNEVADELVNDLPNGNDPGSPGGMQYDEKNIRRRVYDALNVLMAMGIITKEKKEIFWKGLPQGPQLSLDRLKGERLRILQKLDQQRRYIADLTTQQAQFRALMRRNKDQTVEQLMLSNASGTTDVTALPLPFVLIQVDRSATIEIKIADDNRQAEFDFDASPFKITGDEQVLQEICLVDNKDPMIFRAHTAAADAMSPRPIHHTQAKAMNGPASASNRAHPQLPPPARPIRPGLGPSLGSPQPFNLANLPPAAQIAALNMARNGGDLSLLGSAVAAAQGRDWLRSPQGLHSVPGSPNFRLPSSPMLLRPPGGLGGTRPPSLAQQLAMINPGGLLGQGLPAGPANSPRNLLLAAGSQPASSQSLWGQLGQISHQGNHARLLHGSPSNGPLQPSSNVAQGGGNSLRQGGDPASSNDLGPGPTPTPHASGGHSQPTPASQPTSMAPQFGPGAAQNLFQTPALQPSASFPGPGGQGPLPSQSQAAGQGLPRLSSGLMKPPLSSPPFPLGAPPLSVGNPSTNSIPNAMLSAAWLSQLQRGMMPQSTPLSGPMPLHTPASGPLSNQMNGPNGLSMPSPSQPMQTLAQQPLNSQAQTAPLWKPPS